MKCIHEINRTLLLTQYYFAQKKKKNRNQIKATVAATSKSETKKN